MTKKSYPLGAPMEASLETVYLRVMKIVPPEDS